MSHKLCNNGRGKVIKMTVKELISELLNYPMDSTITIQKELAYNIWVNSEIKIKKEDGAVIFSFDFPSEKFEIKRK